MSFGGKTENVWFMTEQRQHFPSKTFECSGAIMLSRWNIRSRPPHLSRPLKTWRKLKNISPHSLPRPTSIRITKHWRVKEHLNVTFLPPSLQSEIMQIVMRKMHLRNNNIFSKFKFQFRVLFLGHNWEPRNVWCQFQAISEGMRRKYLLNQEEYPCHAPALSYSTLIMISTICWWGTLHPWTWSLISWPGYFNSDKDFNISKLWLSVVNDLRLMTLASQLNI